MTEIFVEIYCFYILHLNLLPLYCLSFFFVFFSLHVYTSLRSSILFLPSPSTIDYRPFYYLTFSLVKKSEIRKVLCTNINEGRCRLNKIYFRQRYCPHKYCREFTRSSYYRFSNPSCKQRVTFVNFVASCESPFFFSFLPKY